MTGMEIHNCAFIVIQNVSRSPAAVSTWCHQPSNEVIDSNLTNLLDLT